MKNRNMEEIKKWIILLLGADNGRPIRGKLMFQKEMFILAYDILQKLGILSKEEVERIFNFKPHYYGPYSKKIEDTLNLLQQQGLVKVEKQDDVIIYTLTDKGKNEFKKVLDKQGDDVIKLIEKLKIGSERLGYKGLLKYVYINYPEFIDRSLIKDEVLGG